ncbi:MAG: hypothetical protein U0V72_03405 [Cytophagales bacterium]
MANYSINQQKLENYAKEFSKKACDSFFSLFKTNIVGTEIMKITPIEQINYFILFNLFENWKQEVSKLESPYFDYSKIEVKDALKNFMNTLSMNIKIERKDFEPLLIQSVIYTVNLSVLPKSFFVNFYNKLPEKISLEHLISLEKYFKINNHFYKCILEKSKELGKDEITRTYILNILSENLDTLNEDTLNKENILFNLNNIHNYDFESLLIPINSSNISNDTPENIEEIIQENIESEEISHNIQDENIEKNIDNLKKESFKSDPLSNKVINMDSAMSINQRFMFIDHLFKGEKWEFDAALTKLENIHTYEGAIQMLLQEYAIKYDWDTENDQVAEFFEFVGKKYTS